MVNFFEGGLYKKNLKKKYVLCENHVEVRAFDGMCTHQRWASAT
jgi:hypothetical protein